jgi:hypothetical protein
MNKDTKELWLAGVPVSNVRMKRALVGEAVMLNNTFARVLGADMPYAIVAAFEPRISAEFAWSTVLHVVAYEDGLFRT